MSDPHAHPPPAEYPLLHFMGLGGSLNSEYMKHNILSVPIIILPFQFLWQAAAQKVQWVIRKVIFLLQRRRRELFISTSAVCERCDCNIASDFYIW